MLLLQSVEETHSATAASPQEVKATYGGQKCLLSSGLQGAGRLHCLTQQDRGMPADSPVALTWSRLLAAVHAWSSSSSTQQAAPSHHSLHANLQSCSPRLRKAKPCHWLRWKRERIPQYKERVGWGRYRRLCPVVKSRAVKVRNHSAVPLGWADPGPPDSGAAGSKQSCARASQHPQEAGHLASCMVEDRRKSEEGQPRAGGLCPESSHSTSPSSMLPLLPLFSCQSYLVLCPPSQPHGQGWQVLGKC